MSDLPDSPSALFRADTRGAARARRKQLEAEEAEVKAKEEAKRKALDPGPRMDGGGAEGGEPPPTEPRVIPPKPPPPKKWGVPPPPKDKLPIPQGADAGASSSRATQAARYSRHATG